MEKEIRIIDISEGKNNSYKIWFSNGFVAMLPKQYFMYFGPYKGQKYSKDEFIHICNFVRLKKEVSYAVNLVKKRYYSQNVVIEKLKKVKKLKFFEINLILDYLRSECGFSESNSLESMVDVLNNKNLSHSTVEKKLLERKFKYKMIQGFNSFNHDDECKKAFEIGRKYLDKKRKIDNESDYSLNVYNLLSYKGFTFEVINDVMNSLFNIKSN